MLTTPLTTPRSPRPGRTTVRHLAHTAKRWGATALLFALYLIAAALNSAFWRIRTTTATRTEQAQCPTADG